MIYRILDILVPLIVFLVTKYFVYWFTEKLTDFPKWLEYKPYYCGRCLGFWLPMGIFCSIWYVFNVPIIGILGIVLTILDTIAKIIDEKNKYQ